MSREVHAIPPAPRHAVRWKTAMAYRWPLALMAFLLAVYGGLWTLMLFFASNGKPIDDRRLDREAVVVTGRCFEVAETHAHIAGSPAIWVDYQFEFGRDTFLGKSFAPAGLAVGDAVKIELLADAPEKNRLQGGRISLLGDFVSPALWMTVVPGVVFFGIWLFGVLRTRDVLVHGDVAVAHILDCKPLRYVVPSMYQVAFAFRDRRAKDRVGHHWVRTHSHVGERIVTEPESVVVVHDREHPERHRLVVADEFSQRLRSPSEPGDQTAVFVE